MRYKLNPVEREARRTDRAAHRKDATERVSLRQEWREVRGTLALKRAEKAKKKAAKKLAAAIENGERPRGVDRVPVHLRANPLQRPPLNPGPAGPVFEQPPGKQFGDGTRGPRPTFRAARTPRRRDMPGAVERRIVRNQKTWATGSRV